MQRHVTSAHAKLMWLSCVLLQVCCTGVSVLYSSNTGLH